MAAVLFFRHLFIGIKRRPLQPFLLTFLIMLAVSVCIASSDVEILLRENENAIALACNGKADYKVTVNSFSPTRFILLQEEDKRIPEGVDVCGIYALPLTFGEENHFIYGVACDYTDASRLFDLELTVYLPLTAEKVEESIYISEDFSKQYQVEVGDGLTFTLLGQSLNFTVYGITQKKPFGQYDVMFPIASAGVVLSQRSLFLSSLFESGGIVPSGMVYIRSNGKVTQAELQNIFPGMTVSNIAETTEDPYGAFGIVTLLMKLLTLVFTFVVIYCCFHILSMQRQEETYLFSCIGAKRYLLNLISSLEITFYFLIGGGLGITEINFQKTYKY